MPLLADANQANVVASMDGVEPRQTIVDPGVTARSVLVVTRLNRPRLRLLEHFEQALTDPKALPAAERCDLYKESVNGFVIQALPYYLCLSLSCLESALRLIRICVYPET